MNKAILPFALAFIAGAVIALVIRTTQHEPYAQPARNPGPAITAAASAQKEPAASEHEHGSHQAAPVNTVCPICGMDVDPETPTALYKGQIIGFGCKNCPEEFAANPTLYGEAALQNKVVEE